MPCPYVNMRGPIEHTMSRIPLPLRFAIGLVIILALSLWAFYAFMKPPMSDLNAMALFLSITTAISGLAGYVANRLGWLERTPSLRLSLIVGYALASVVTVLNVWVTARLMFTSTHDFQLATILLAFAAGIAVLLGYFLSGGLTRRIEQLQEAAHRLAGGDLSARVPLEGSDEVTTLSASFNEMAERLQAADRQQRELVAWASHDLQTPLTAIRVQIEALADGMVEDPATIQRYLQTTQRQINDFSTLIDDLFQVAQFDAGGLVIRPSACSLSDLISDTLESFSALAGERGVTLSGSAAPGVDPARLDAPRIGRVFNNLIGNALRHTPAGGAVALTAHRQDGRILIDVTDSGEGISPADLPYVFERFYRGDKSRNRGTGGSGLGLAIARGIVRAHGGEITVESRPGAGAAFHIWLPA